VSKGAASIARKTKLKAALKGPRNPTERIREYDNEVDTIRASARKLILLAAASLPRVLPEERRNHGQNLLRPKTTRFSPVTLVIRLHAVRGVTSPDLAIKSIRGGR
jgi:hypothetical protein